MKNDPNARIEDKLDTVIGLLQHLIAIELSKEGMTQENIGKSLRVAKATVVKMLKGTKKE